MVLEILCVEPIYPQYSGVLETCLALRYWFLGAWQRKCQVLVHVVFPLKTSLFEMLGYLA